MSKLIFIWIISLALLVSCKNEDTIIDNPDNKDFYFFIPNGFPKPNIPENYKVTKERFELGKSLFFEKKLSYNNTISCSNCHNQVYSYSNNGKSIAFGFNSEPTLRSVLPIFNTAFYDIYLWDGGGHNLEEMLYHDLTSALFFNNDTLKLLEILENDLYYKEAFKKAFGENARPHSYLVAQALSDYVRCLISANSKYDKYINGDKSALNSLEKWGMDLFFSDTVNCSKCHVAPLFTDLKYHNTGLVTHYWDRGRYYVTNEYDDIGKFRTPTLRNVAVTAPYMHEGHLFTIKEVLSHYNLGGRYFLNKDPLMRPLNLSSQQIDALVAFLNALTDEEFLQNRKFKLSK